MTLRLVLPASAKQTQLACLALPFFFPLDAIQNLDSNCHVQPCDDEKQFPKLPTLEAGNVHIGATFSNRSVQSDGLRAVGG
jgi:hypothetical protein